MQASSSSSHPASLAAASVNEMISGIGMTPIEAVLVVGALALVSARWLPPRFRRRAAIGAAAVSSASAAVLAVVGLRWQMVPVLAAVVVVLPFTARTMLGKPGGRRVRWWLAGPGSAAGVLSIVAGVGAAIAFPVPDFPAPTGKYAVGTSVVEWTDSDRPETWTTDPDDVRALQAQIWYPAEASPDEVERARYMGRSEAEANAAADAEADYLGFPRFILDGSVTARTNAVPDAPAASGKEQFPVVLFTPGMGVGRTTNTAWAEELASHGYVVAALDHPYDTAAVVFADGRTVRRAKHRVSSDAEGYRLGEELAAVKARDLSSALTHLGRFDSGKVKSVLAGRLDTDRAAVVGMSAGVGGAFQAARTDERFSAVIALDGFPYDGDPGSYDQPVLALTQKIGLEDNPRYLPALERMLKLSTTTGYMLTIPGMTHPAFTDAPLWMPPVPSLVGTLGRTEGNRIIAELTIGFLDAELRGRPADLPGLFAEHGELSVYGAG
ncbi:alpha/beta hydrolase family protein [Streptomyces ovatisporus]|uniref:Alpha/beta hydrolase family protein n=1 Tax=Streptomyces ovatisporus TaxID=1128682 RepID=A0ABV9A6W0_9ACTN